jgi:hypothetical protein
VRIAKEERGRKRRGLRKDDRHGNRKACLCRIDCARGTALLINREGGRYVHARFASGDQASSAEQRRLGVVIKRKEGDRGESFRDGTDARGYRSAEKEGERLGLLCGEASSEPGLPPRELLRTIEPQSEGEAETASLTIGEASGP